MTVTVITPTCDRPVGFALLEMYMQRQTRPPDQWIVADGGQTPVTCRQGQVHVYRPQLSGARNLCSNLLTACAEATGDVIVVAEDDDWYAADHIAQLLSQLEAPEALAAGDPQQRYYNLPKRLWRIYHNRGASLCQTGFKRVLLPLFQNVVQICYDSELYGIDGRFWGTVPRANWNLLHTATVVGLKGLPGQVGLGVGHRPDPHRGWLADPTLAQLRAWIGEDLAHYLP